MSEDDLRFLAEIMDSSAWLLYGDLDGDLDAFAETVFRHEFSDYGFGNVPMTRDFGVAYWFFLSELVRLDLAGYGTSPRGAWLTPKGERFKALVVAHPDALAQAARYIDSEGFISRD